MSIMDTPLKLSEVSYVYRNYEGGKHLVVSNSSGSSALVDTEIANFLECIRKPRKPSELLNSEYEAYVEGLYKAQIIIDGDMDGIDLLRKTVEKAKRNNELAVIPIVTNQCNMACPYCFETKSKEYMDSKLVERLIEYTTERMDNEGLNNIYSSLFGGEPLLNVKICREWLEGINEEVTKREGKLHVALITNGTLLNKDIVDFLSRFESAYIQVTIDGPKEIHDQRRPFRDGRGSFEILMEKLSMVLESGVILQLRINVDNTNQSYIPELVDDLVRRGMKNDNMRVVLERVMTNTASNCMYSHNCISTREYDDVIIPHILYLRKAGFKTVFDIHKRLRPIFCSAYSGKHIAVTPNGDIYSCLDGIGDERFIVGNLWNKGIYNERMNEWTNVSTLNYKKCRECSIAGFCGAGCGAEALNKHGELGREPVCPPHRWSYIGGVVLPSAIHKQFMETGKQEIEV